MSSKIWEVHIPLINELENVLDDVSSDQLSTYFDSYYGYLIAAFDTDFDIKNMKVRINDFINNYMRDNDVEPSQRAIALNFSFKNLIEFTENEISELHPEVSKIIPCSIELNEEKTSKRASASRDNKDSLVEQYKGVIISRGDINKLSNIQLEEIKKEFRSISVFLKLLKDTSNE